MVSELFLNRQALARRVMAVSHRTGDFLLRSGQRSKEYFDKYQLEARPELLSAIAHRMIPLLPPETQVLGALEMGGIPLATAIALITGLPLVFVRKKAKDYGTCLIAEGVSVDARHVTIVEDVITTGGQVVLSAEDLRRNGAIVQHVVCMIDRSQGKHDALTQAGLALRALFTMAELQEAARTGAASTPHGDSDGE